MGLRVLRTPNKTLFLRFFYLLVVCSIFSSFNVSTAQTRIPAKYDGFVFPATGAKPDPVMLEAFLDPVCPDSRDCWPPLKQALQDYAGRVSLIVHPFPLPYHSNAFVACRALHIANKLNASATFPLLESIFKYQENYYDAPTYHMSKASIISSMAKLACTTVGNDLISAFQAGFNDSQTDMAARISFKYGCSRGVYGTPFFFENGFVLRDGGSAINHNKWRSIIDPLLEEKGKREGTLIFVDFHEIKNHDLLNISDYRSNKC